MSAGGMSDGDRNPTSADACSSHPQREYVPGVAIGAAHNITGVGPKVGEWPVIPGHMGFHNWEYVTRKP